MLAHQSTPPPPLPLAAYSASGFPASIKYSSTAASGTATTLQLKFSMAWPGAALTAIKFNSGLGSDSGFNPSSPIPAGAGMSQHPVVPLPAACLKYATAGGGTYSLTFLPSSFSSCP